jgi:hypothetical protein
MKRVTMDEIIETEAKRMLKDPAEKQNTNDRLWDLEHHKAYLAYTMDEVFHKEDDILRLSKINWLAAGCPREPIKRE